MANQKKLVSKWQLFFIASFFISFLFLIFWNNRSLRTQVIVLNDNYLEVFVAKTLKDTYKGLGGRKDLDGIDGMIFFFDFPYTHGIVMRDMHFSIDIVWLDEGRIVDIAPSVPTELGVPDYALTVYRPRINATMVLELPAGFSVEHGLKIGDTLRLP